MVICGIDSSTTATGWGVIDTRYEGNLRLVDSGVLKGSKKDETIDRIIYMENGIKEIVNQYKPELVVIENMNVIRNMQSLRSLAGLITIIEVYLRRKQLLYAVMPPTQWRKLVGIKGKGRDALKQASINFVFEKYNERVTDDEADAICLAEAGSYLNVEVYNDDKKIHKK